ncbi:DUF2526 family protein [Enterobacteriaceae bacterium RIT714]|nr:DUF2526 family protein [Enterobacteriaceae bacterium RIT714]
MSHLAAVIAKVEEALSVNNIRGMNELLCELSHDPQLSTAECYEQQMRLRHAIFKHTEEKAELKEQRRVFLETGGRIL